MFRKNIDLFSEDLISGDRFPGICDFISRFYDRVDELRHPRGQDRREPFIYYADTHFVCDLWPKLQSNFSYVVVSHNGDAAIVDDNPRDCDIVASTMPDNVLAWFGQNVNTQHPRVHSLPIGLENNRWFPEIAKKQVIFRLRYEDRRPGKLLYVNFNRNNNVAERDKAWRACSWATTECGQNGLRFQHYVNQIVNHFYVLSPRGNGIDCHRTWETLYLNRVPVMLRHRNAEFYEDLPILFVDSWDEVTKDLLESKKEEFLSCKWNFSKLKFSYWKDKIYRTADGFIGDCNGTASYRK